MLKKRNQKGFTLIEIIAVLVILGILAAVAVPKYLGMQKDAELAAAKGVVAELNGRASLAYAKQLIATGNADGGSSGGYNGFNGSVGGWSGTPTEATGTISALQRVDGSATFAASWQGGDLNSPGYWNNVTAN